MSTYNTTRPDLCLTGEQYIKLAATSKALERSELPAPQRHSKLLAALLSPGDVVTLMRMRFRDTIGCTYTTHQVTVDHINNDGTLTTKCGNRFDYNYIDRRFCADKGGITIGIKQSGTKDHYTIIKVQSEPTKAPVTPSAAKIATVAAAAVQLALFA